MSDHATVPPLPVLPPFILPDQHGTPVNTARLRGRRNLVLLLLPAIDTRTAEYLKTFSVRQDEWSWLHTEVVIVVPTVPHDERTCDVGFPVLQDNGAVRTALLPEVQSDVAALFVADTEAQVVRWHTARHVTSLPDVDSVLAWAWDVARPRGACDGGVLWARPATPPTLSPAPIGRFTIGTSRSPTARYHRKS